MIDDLKDLTLIARGGQKEVYTATHDSYGTVIFKKVFSGQDSFERTIREVRAVSLLQSDAVPEIIAHNCDDVNPPYLWIIEKYVSGETIRKTIESGRVYSIEEVVKFIDTALDIAVKAETLSIVHRDIKPENIIIDNENNFWLLDFGIARHLDLESITQTNTPYGLFTLGYASSEQFRNLKKDIDIRTDLFSIGVVAYEMITGTNPYRVGTNDPLMVLKRMETVNIPPVKILGDSQFQLSGFISLIGDVRRTRRPANAQTARVIFNVVKATLRLS